MQTIIITPAEVEARLTIVPDCFKTIIEDAKERNLKLEYTYMQTPFGKYPMLLTVVEPVQSETMDGTWSISFDRNGKKVVCFIPDKK